MSRVPEADGTAEFLALTGLAAGMIGLRRAATGVELRMTFDRAVFPCCWLFASYGKLLGHHVVVLEPATDGTLTVGESSRRTRLDAGEELTTEICYALTSEE